MKALSHINKKKSNGKTKSYKVFFVFIAAFLISLQGYSQTKDYQMIVGTQVDLSFFRSRQQIASLMLGIKTKDSSQVLIGPFIKYFNNDIGHQKTQVGLRAHAHIPIYKNWYAGITANYVINGQFYLKDSNQTTTIYQKSSLTGTFSLGYAVKQNLFIFTGLTFSDYQPLNYYKNKSFPFGTNYGNIGINYNFDLNKKSSL